MNRRALVTGASQGIGFVIARTFQQRGYDVLAPEIKDMDLLSDESIAGYLSSLKEPVDVLVNNAGINPINLCKDITDDAIDATLQINMIAPMKLIRGILPMMIRRNYGRIVNISSVWSVVSKPGRVVYATSKSGLNAITRTVAVEHAVNNILINSVAPGFVNTEMTSNNNTEDEISALKAKIPINRLAEPEEIAEVVFFLCSDANTYITGQVITVDGGYTCL
ncbi:MAG: SDR family oxidoreductase [Spirochaetes bacterium]|nr:SDR family oxidoreductase [Spirochaetota bacterium]